MEEEDKEKEIALQEPDLEKKVYDIQHEIYQSCVNTKHTFANENPEEMKDELRKLVLNRALIFETHLGVTDPFLFTICPISKSIVVVFLIIHISWIICGSQDIFVRKHFDGEQ
jgi:hypothetical protein